MTTPIRRLAAAATDQMGAFSRAQARDAGWSDRQLRTRLADGTLQQVGRHAFRSPLRSPSVLADLTATWLDIGEPCWFSGPTAAALHGFDDVRLAHPFHVTVPRGRRVTRVGVVVHTAMELPRLDQCRVLDLPVLTPARTLIDLARHADAEQLTTALDSGLRDGGLSEDFLHRRIVALRGRGRYGIPKLLDVIAGAEVSRGGHSWLEREYLRITARAGLPRPVTQEVLSRAGHRMIRVDCRYPGTNVVVELLGYRFHRSTAQMEGDAQRLNALVLDGFTPYQFTYTQVVGAADAVAETVSRALATCDTAA